MPTIFISHRRSDEAARAMCGRIYSRLCQEFGASNVFYDLEHSLAESGTDFVARIKSYIALSDVMLVVMGAQWLSELKKRETSEDVDYVRMELQWALHNRPSMPIIPVVIADGTEFNMPKESELGDDIATISRKEFFRVHKTVEQYIENDLKNLVARLKIIDHRDDELEKTRKELATAIEARRRLRRRQTTFLVLIAFLAVIAAVLAGLRFQQTIDELQQTITAIPQVAIQTQAGVTLAAVQTDLANAQAAVEAVQLAADTNATALVGQVIAGNDAISTYALTMTAQVTQAADLTFAQSMNAELAATATALAPLPAIATDAAAGQASQLTLTAQLGSIIDSQASQITSLQENIAAQNSEQATLEGVATGVQATITAVGRDFNLTQTLVALGVTQTHIATLATATPTFTPTLTPTDTPSPTWTSSPTPTPTLSPTPTPTPEPTPTPLPTECILEYDPRFAMQRDGRGIDRVPYDGVGVYQIDPDLATKPPPFRDGISNLKRIGVGIPTELGEDFEVIGVERLETPIDGETYWWRVRLKDNVESSFSALGTYWVRSIDVRASVGCAQYDPPQRMPSDSRNGTIIRSLGMTREDAPPIQRSSGLDGAFIRFAYAPECFHVTEEVVSDGAPTWYRIDLQYNDGVRPGENDEAWISASRVEVVDQCDEADFLRPPPPDTQR